MINVDGNKILYSPDVKNLDKTPSRDIFGYLIASQGLTIHTAPLDIVEKLFQLKKMSTTYTSYISVMLDNIVWNGDLEEYMDVLSNEPYKFITSEGELVDVEDLSWI